MIAGKHTLFFYFLSALALLDMGCRSAVLVKVTRVVMPATCIVLLPKAGRQRQQHQSGIQLHQVLPTPKILTGADGCKTVLLYVTAEEARSVHETGSPCEQSNLIELVVVLTLFQMPFLLSPLSNMLPLWHSKCPRRKCCWT